jgi:hypothetical protein
MIFVPSVVICGGPFKLFGMEEVHDTRGNGRKFVR